MTTLFDNRCRICGCTTTEVCPSGCTWVNRAMDLCSECVDDDGNEVVR